MPLWVAIAIVALQLPTAPASPPNTARPEPVDLACHPIDNTARVLSSANPLDTHPDWAGENSIGTAWMIIATSRVSDQFGNTYLIGSMVSPRQEEAPGRAFVLEREWVCTARLIGDR